MSRSELRRLTLLLTSANLLAASLSFLGCSMMLPEELEQCATDSDCSARGFEGAVCDVAAGVCVATHAIGGSSGGSSSGGTTTEGTGGTSTGGVSTGGTGAVSGGGGSGSSSAGGTGGSSGGGGIPPNVPTAVRASGASLTQMHGGSGARLNPDPCPEDQVLVGMTFWTAANGGYLTRAQGHCATVDVDTSGEWSLTLTDGGDTRIRGRGFTNNPAYPDEPDDVVTTVECPAGEVVVGFDGRAQTYSYAVRLYCAPLDITGAPEDPAVDVGDPSPLTTVGSNNGLAYGLDDCPRGQVARGPATRAGVWLDAFGLVCTRLKLAYPEGTSCTSASECESGRCDETCVACEAPTNCRCAQFEDSEYLVCSDELDTPAAQASCESNGASLARIDSAPENGWLRMTADYHGIDVLKLGGTDAAVEGEWRWPDGDQFWSGDATGKSVDNLFSNWGSGEPNDAGEGEHCIHQWTSPEGAAGEWLDIPCDHAAAYACE